MLITVFTSKTCIKCPEAKAVVEKFAMENRCEVEYVDIEEGDNLIKAVQLQIGTVPSVIIENIIVSKGEVPTEQQLIEASLEYQERFKN